MNKIKFVGTKKNAPRRLLKTVCLSVSRSNRCIEKSVNFLFLLLAQHTVTVVTIVALHYKWATTVSRFSDKNAIKCVSKETYRVTD